MTESKTSTYKDVRLTRRTRKNGKLAYGRTANGDRVLRIVADAMAAGHLVSMRSRFDDEGCEFMDADIVRGDV